MRELSSAIVSDGTGAAAQAAKFARSARVKSEEYQQRYRLKCRQIFEKQVCRAVLEGSDQSLVLFLTRACLPSAPFCNGQPQSSRYDVPALSHSRTMCSHNAVAEVALQSATSPRMLMSVCLPMAQIAAMTTVEEAEEKADSESDADSFGKEFEEMLEDSDDEVGLSCCPVLES